jgi:hypothetical protein
MENKFKMKNLGSFTVKIKDHLINILSIFFNISVFITFCDIFLVFIIINKDSFQQIPFILKLFIPFGFIALSVKILSINFGNFLFNDIEESKEFYRSN